MRIFWIKTYDMFLVRSIVFSDILWVFLFRKCVPVFGVTRRNCLKSTEKSQLLRVILVISLPISPSKTCQAKRLTRLRCYCPSDPVVQESDVLTFDTIQNVVFDSVSSTGCCWIIWVLHREGTLLSHSFNFELCWALFLLAGQRFGILLANGFIDM